jgi:transposase
LLKARGKQRTDSTHILAHVRELNRLEFVGETMRVALNALAEVAPEWLRGIVLLDWFERYSRPFSSWRLPQKETEQRVLGEQIGRDGIYLLTQIYAPDAPSALRTLPAVEFLRCAWVYQYYQDDDQTRWRDSGNLPPGALILSSPYDPQMRYSRKRDDTAWAGYKVHLTETCELDYPHLITHVETTLATLADIDALDTIHRDLAADERLPGQHLVDCGYVSAETLTHAQQAYDIDLFGPTRPDKSWQNKTEAAFDISQFSIDFEHEIVTCPQGEASQGWKLGVGFRGKPAIRVWFPRRVCRVCPVRTQCTTSPKGRQLLFPPRETFLSLQSARQRERTEAFREGYQKRSGIEGTISQATNALGMRRTRYCGLAKVHLQHLVTAAAMNLTRVLDWMLEKPRSTTRKSAFARLAPI